MAVGRTTSERRVHGTRAAALILAAAAVAVLATGPAAFAKAKAKAHAPSCGLATPAMVNTALGTNVTAPKVTKQGSVLVCTYPEGALSDKALIRYETGMTAKTFAASESGFTQHGEPVTPATGYGSQAYSSTIGGGDYVTNTLVVLKGRTELLVTASAPLNQVEALASAILPKL